MSGDSNDMWRNTQTAPQRNNKKIENRINVSPAIKHAITQKELYTIKNRSFYGKIVWSYYVNRKCWKFNQLKQMYYGEYQ